MEVTIRTQKPNLLRLWLRHIKTRSFQKSFSRIFVFGKNLSRKVVLFCRRLKIKNKSEIFNFKSKKSKISSERIVNLIKAEGLSLELIQEKNSFINNFVLRHIGLFIIAAIVFASNFLAAKTTDIIWEDLISEISLSESAAVSEEDLEGLISEISKYTPGIKEDPKKITNRLAFKDQIVMTDGQYISKPPVLATSTNGDSIQAEQKSQSSPRQITSYQVRGGDTLGLIASKFGISVATLKAANSLSSDTIKPGQKLTILPTDGLVHIVKKGENLSAIVAYYKGSLHKTIQENGLGQADRIFAGQKIVIVDGKKPAPTRVASRSTGSSGQVSGIRVNRGRGPNHFPFGWCTWYVASRRYVPWRGNASAWPYRARSYGYQTGRTPAVGAIMVTRESRWGHVAYVEAVHGNTVTISEMNFSRWGRVNRRTLSASYGVYIY